MPRPYSDDLRWRMVYQRIFYQRSYDEIASQLFICPKTVYQTIRTSLNTGNVKPCRLGRPSGSVTLFEHEEYILMECILRTPQIQLHEIANHYYAYLLLQIKRIALQRNDNLRQQFKTEISVFNLNQLFFLDETGIVRVKQLSSSCHLLLGKNSG